MKPFNNIPRTGQATQPVSMVLGQSRVFTALHHPASKADIYVGLGE